MEPQKDPKKHRLVCIGIVVAAVLFMLFLAYIGHIVGDMVLATL